MFEAKKAWEVLSKNGVTAPLCLEVSDAHLCFHRLRACIL